MSDKTGTEQGEQQRSSGINETLRSVARDLQSGSTQERVLGQVVDSLADASDALREKDVTDVVRGAGGFAKRNPVVFLGAAALAGFAATRLVRTVVADKDAAQEITPEQDELA